jgi:hypothetical protein
MDLHELIFVAIAVLLAGIFFVLTSIWDIAKQILSELTFLREMYERQMRD